MSETTFAARGATPGDAAFLSDLFARPHVTGKLHRPESFSFTRGEHAIIERDGSSFGYLALELECEWLMSVRALAVWEPGGGAGRFALEFAKHRAFDELGAHRVFLEILESNEPMRRLCEGVGFRVEGLYRDGYCDEAGGFHNLVPYGLLRDDSDSSDALASRGSVRRLDHDEVLFDGRRHVYLPDPFGNRLEIIED